MKARTLAAVVAIGLAGLVSGCKAKPQDLTPATPTQPAQPSTPQEPKSNEDITPECIHVYKENVIISSNIGNGITYYDWISLNWCRGTNASLILENRSTLEAETLFGEKVLAVYNRGESPVFRVNDNTASVRYMGSYETTWKNLCDVLNCEGLLEKQNKLRNEQLPEQPQERVWKEIFDGVYFLNNNPGNELPDAIFTAGGDILNLDSLWVKAQNEVYADYGRDGIVDEVANSITGARYYRNVETAELFNRADAALAQAKKEIGLEE